MTSIFASVLLIGHVLLAIGSSQNQDSCSMFSAGWFIVCNAAQGLAVVLVSIVCRHFVVWDLAFAVGVVIASGFLAPSFFGVVFTSTWGEGEEEITTSSPSSTTTVHASTPSPEDINNRHQFAVSYTSAICVVAMISAVVCAIIDSRTPLPLRRRRNKGPRLTEVEIREAAAEAVGRYNSLRASGGSERALMDVVNFQGVGSGNNGSSSLVVGGRKSVESVRTSLGSLQSHSTSQEEGEEGGGGGGGGGGGVAKDASPLRMARASSLTLGEKRAILARKSVPEDELCYDDEAAAFFSTGSGSTVDVPVSASSSSSAATTSSGGMRPTTAAAAAASLERKAPVRGASLRLEEKEEEDDNDDEEEEESEEDIAFGKSRKSERVSLLNNNKKKKTAGRKSVESFASFSTKNEGGGVVSANVAENNNNEDDIEVDLTYSQSLIANLRSLNGQYYLLVACVIILSGFSCPFDASLTSVVHHHRGPFSQQWFLDLSSELQTLYLAQVMIFGPLVGMLIDRVGKRPVLLIVSAVIGFVFFFLFVLTLENWTKLPNWKRVFLAPELLLSIHAVSLALATVSCWSSVVLVLPSKLCIIPGLSLAFAAANLGDLLFGLLTERTDPIHVRRAPDAWVYGVFCTLCAVLGVMGWVLKHRDDRAARGHVGLLSLPSTRAKRRDGYARLSNAVPGGSENLALMAVEIPDSRMVSREELRLEAIVGTGATGTVFRARWHGGIVAAKRVNLAKVASPALVCEEIKMMVMLSHPNVVAFYGTACVDPDLYILSELCGRGTLYEVLHGDNAANELTPVIRANLAVDAAAGMAYLHSRGIIHRDLKSLNLLVTHALGVKVADFGLSRLGEGGDGNDNSSNNNNHNMNNNNHGGMGGGGGGGKNPHHTAFGKSSALGTVHWSAPEVLRDGLFSYKSDVYSFGVVLWEIFSPPEAELYGTLTPLQVALKVLEGARPSPLPPTPPCPPLVHEAMKQCWKRKTDKRPPLPHLLETLKIAKGGLEREEERERRRNKGKMEED